MRFRSGMERTPCRCERLHSGTTLYHRCCRRLRSTTAVRNQSYRTWNTIHVYTVDVLSLPGLVIMSLPGNRNGVRNRMVRMLVVLIASAVGTFRQLASGAWQSDGLLTCRSPEVFWVRVAGHSCRGMIIWLCAHLQSGPFPLVRQCSGSGQSGQE